MERILDSIWTWQGAEEGCPRLVRGYFVPESECLIDPPYAEDGALVHLPGDATPKTVVLTDHFHIRSAAAWRHETGCELWLHEAEHAWTDKQVEHAFRDGDMLCERFKVIRIPNSFFFGESALLWEDKSVLFVGDAVQGRNDHDLWLTGTQYLRRTNSTPAEAVQGLRVLLDYDFDALLPSHGSPVLSGARDALLQFIEHPVLLEHVPPDAD